MADLNEKLNELNNTEDTTAQFDAQDIEQNKVMAVLAYLGWLVLVPILAAKNSKFAMYHANQGLVLAIVATVCLVALSILSIIPFLGLIFMLAEALLGIVFLVFAILGIVNAAQGKAKELPLIGKFKIFK